MPFTPLHMGPGLLLKSILGGSFSLMVFGWAQIMMDIQPLIVMISGEGHLHGFSHTYPGAFLLMLVSALTGKYLSQLGLQLLKISTRSSENISWKIVFFSAFIGTFSHVLLDSFMHADMAPFYPWSAENSLISLLSISQLHYLCLFTGIVGLIIYAAVLKFRNDEKTQFNFTLR